MVDTQEGIPFQTCAGILTWGALIGPRLRTTGQGRKEGRGEGSGN